MGNFLYTLPILQESAGSGQLISMILPFGLIILVFYFLIIRPQRRKQRETQAMLSAVSKNDKVATVGGIRGTVVAVKDDSVIVRVDDNVKMEFSKSAISTILESKNAPKESDKETKQG
jgi:preprotein translocase subunit YajC